MSDDKAFWTDLAAVELVAAGDEYPSHEEGRRAREAYRRLRRDIARLRELAETAFEHPNFTPEPGDERLGYVPPVK